MISTHISCDHNTYHIRFRDTWLQREKEATRPFTFQPKALEMFENQYKSELLIRSHPRGRGFESLQVHQEKLWNFIFHSFFATIWRELHGCEPSVSGEFWRIPESLTPSGSHPKTEYRKWERRFVGFIKPSNRRSFCVQKRLVSKYDTNLFNKKFQIIMRKMRDKRSLRA